jgi:heme exporter protein C
MAATMLAGMLLMTLASWMYTIAVALVRVRCILRERGVLAPTDGSRSGSWAG